MVIGVTILMAEYKEFKKKNKIVAAFMVLPFVLVGCSSPKDQEIENLEQEVQALEEESPSTINENYKDIENVTQTFAESVFTENKEGYKERKEEASTIMNQQMLDYLFPSDEYNQEDVTATVNDLEIYVQADSATQDRVNTMARFNHVITYDVSEEQEESTTFIELELSKEDGEWIVTDFRDNADQAETETG